MTGQLFGTVLLRIRVFACFAACLLSVITATAAAQTAQDSVLHAPAGGFYGTRMDRATVIGSQGLNNPALNLTYRQKAQIDEIVDAYLAEEARILEQFPAVQGVPPSVEAIIAQDAALVTFNTALDKALDDTQRHTWRTAQAARLPPRSPEGLRPPGY